MGRTVGRGGSAALVFLLPGAAGAESRTAPAEIGKYVREPPRRPAGGGRRPHALGRIGPTAFGATILDLAQRGYLKITQTRVDRGLLPDRTEYEFTILKDVTGIPPGTVRHPTPTPTTTPSRAETDEAEQTVARRHRRAWHSNRRRSTSSSSVCPP